MTFERNMDISQIPDASEVQIVIEKVKNQRLSGQAEEVTKGINYLAASFLTAINQTLPGKDGFHTFIVKRSKLPEKSALVEEIMQRFRDTMVSKGYFIVMQELPKKWFNGCKGYKISIKRGTSSRQSSPVQKPSE